MAYQVQCCRCGKPIFVTTAKQAGEKNYCAMCTTQVGDELPAQKGPAAKVETASAKSRVEKTSPRRRRDDFDDDYDDRRPAKSRDRDARPRRDDYDDDFDDDRRPGRSRDRGVPLRPRRDDYDDRDYGDDADLPPVPARAARSRGNVLLLILIPVGAIVFALTVVLVVVLVGMGGSEERSDDGNRSVKKSTPVETTGKTGQGGGNPNQQPQKDPPDRRIQQPGAEALVPNALPQPGLPPLVAGKNNMVDLIGMLEPNRDTVWGKWAVADTTALHCNERMHWPRIQFPYQPPEEYDFVVVFSQPFVRNGVSLIMPNPNGGSFFWTVGNGFGNDYGFYTGPGTRWGKVIGLVPANQIHTTTVQVRRNSIAGIFDGKVLISAPVTYRELTTDNFRKLRDSTLLGVACDDPTVFHYVRVVEITGTGRTVR